MIYIHVCDATGSKTGKPFAIALGDDGDRDTWENAGREDNEREEERIGSDS